MPSNSSAIPSRATNAVARTATRQRLRVRGNLNIRWLGRPPTEVGSSGSLSVVSDQASPR